MIEVNVSESAANILNMVTPHFEERLRNDFKYHSERLIQMYPNQKTSLKSMVISDNNLNVKLSNLNISEFGKCTLNNLQADLQMFNILLDTHMDHVTIEGNYNQPCRSILIPEAGSGKITLRLENVTMNGNIGIYIVEDSYLVKNCDVNMKIERIDTRVICKNGSIDEVFEYLETDIEKTLMKYLSKQVLHLFLIEYIIFNQLSAPIVEISVSELLLDEPEEVIALSAERISKVNQKIDTLLQVMNATNTAKVKTVLETRAVDISLDNGDTQKICNTGCGRLENLWVTRLGDMSFYEKEGVQYIYGYLKLKTFQFKYPSFTTKNETETNGRVEVGAFRNQLFVKLSISTVGKIRIEAVNAVKIMDVQYNTFNLEDLLNQNYNLESVILGSIQGVVFPLLENWLLDGLVHASTN
ncbi:hemolymph juvenile hormone binding protein (JHBP) [Popillia japonica]|uniref:Hemolymph juvenile hormone binding protein (JHBP) n=1 Tax=Popillia japonica TaxID=7064 RepID=A0AAW1KJ07_POPJA